MNQLVLVGRLTNDPDIDIKENGKKISAINIAVRRPYKNSEGTYDADFIRCILWNGVAESSVKYCKKGDCVGVIGRIQTVHYEDEDKNPKMYTEVIGDHITFLSKN